MPGNVSLSESQGQVQVNPNADFAKAFVGCSLTNPVATGACTGLYSNPAQASADLGIGDAVDALMQAITQTPIGNPAPTASIFYKTPNTTVGTRGTTLTVSGVSGTSVVAKSATTPLGTYQMKAKVTQGGTVGAAGMFVSFSFDNGVTFMPPTAVGTAVTVEAQLLVNGVLTNTGMRYSLAAGTLVTGDNWSESQTIPPTWVAADLYTAGSPATGAIAAIAQSAQQIGEIVISEPVLATDFATIIAGLNYALNTYGKRFRVTCRFRDPLAAESDSTYVAAFATFLAAATLDSRITVLAGSCILTDAFRAFQYYRSFLPAYVAREQSFVAVPGQAGERLAQNPGWVARGPLEGASLRDSNGNPIGHDEFVLGGIDAANGAATGSGVCLCYRQNVQVQGTYVSNRGTTMYPALSTILTPADRAVANGIETAAVGIALTAIGGADIFDPVTFVLDADILNGLTAKIVKQIRDNYAKEIQNAGDPNLVVINPVVSVNGAQVTISGTIYARFYGYTDTIALTFTASR